MDGTLAPGASAPVDPEPTRTEGLVLSGVAGAVDGLGYLLLHVFTAHVTGNTVHGATSLGTGALREASRALLAVGLFAAGVALGAILRDACERRGVRARPIVLAASAALLALFALLGVGLAAGAPPPAGWRPLAALAAAAIGIGSENAVMPRVGGRRVRTFITGTIVELVEALVAAAHAGGGARRSDLERAGALGAIWGAYFAGGVASAVAGIRLGSLAALLPALALAAVAARAR